jgi:hypothetical protein
MSGEPPHTMAAARPKRTLDTCSLYVLLTAHVPHGPFPPSCPGTARREIRRTLPGPGREQRRGPADRPPDQHPQPHHPGALLHQVAGRGTPCRGRRQPALIQPAAGIEHSGHDGSGAASPAASNPCHPKPPAKNQGRISSPSLPPCGAGPGWGVGPAPRKPSAPRAPRQPEPAVPAGCQMGPRHRPTAPISQNQRPGPDRFRTSISLRYRNV